LVLALPLKVKLCKHKSERVENSFERLKNLTDFPGKTNLQAISKEFEPDRPAIDHYIGLEIKINRSAESRQIKLTNYNLTVPGLVDKYLSELLEWVRRARALRFNRDFRPLKNDCIPSKKSSE
jgi:hypothetical protein